MEGQTGIGVSAASESLVMKGLYGGAVQMGIPARFKDVSLARPVPDYQEGTLKLLQLLIHVINNTSPHLTRGNSLYEVGLSMTHTENPNPMVVELC